MPQPDRQPPPVGAGVAPASERQETANGAEALCLRLGLPALRADLPGPLSAAAPLGVVGIYLIVGCLLGLIVAVNPDTWTELLNAEGSPFAWTSCGLLLSCGVVAVLIGLVQQTTPRSERPSWWTSGAWWACGTALFVAALDEGFRVHERVTRLPAMGRAGPFLAYIHPVLLVYGLGGLMFAVLIVQRRYRRCLALKVLLAVGLVAYAVSIGLEALTSLGLGPFAEEMLEFTAEASFLSAFYLAFLAELASVARIHLAGPPHAPA
ncbi:MAG: hypothetical protein FJX75_18105 [Armatimonadetes bacterium]|nr:hypothetical protein [Armatimonadota bacterium]